MRLERPNEILDLFRCACYFYDNMLQEVLLAQEIIPNMNTYSAILYLIEILQQDEVSPNKRKPESRVRNFLYDYCTFYLSRNLPVILRQDQSKILKLDKNEIFNIVTESLYYIIDEKADVEVIL